MSLHCPGPTDSASISSKHRTASVFEAAATCRRQQEAHQEASHRCLSHVRAWLLGARFHSLWNNCVGGLEPRACNRCNTNGSFPYSKIKETCKMNHEGEERILKQDFKVFLACTDDAGSPASPPPFLSSGTWCTFNHEVLPTRNSV